MTQKKIGNDLYVFKQEAYEITADTSATTIYVQEELVPAFKTANASLASKIKPINYYVMVATKQPWGDYINADDATGESGPTGSTGEVVTGDAEPSGQAEQSEQAEPSGESGASGQE